MITITTATVEQLATLGGNLWESGAKRRVYFNQVVLEAMFGISSSQYGTGRIKSAILDGVAISNSQARKIYSDLSSIKLWVDLIDGSINVQEPRGEVFYDCDYVDFFTETLVFKLKKLA